MPEPAVSVGRRANINKTRTNDIYLGINFDVVEPSTVFFFISSRKSWNRRVHLRLMMFDRAERK